MYTGTQMSGQNQPMKSMEFTLYTDTQNGTPADSINW